MTKTSHSYGWCDDRRVTSSAKWSFKGFLLVWAALPAVTSAKVLCRSLEMSNKVRKQGCLSCIKTTVKAKRKAFLSKSNLMIHIFFGWFGVIIWNYVKWLEKKLSRYVTSFPKCSIKTSHQNINQKFLMGKDYFLFSLKTKKVLWRKKIPRKLLFITFSLIFAGWKSYSR